MKRKKRARARELEAKSRRLTGDLQQGFNKTLAETDARLKREHERLVVELNHHLGRTAEQIAADTGLDLRFVIDEIEKLIEAAKKKIENINRNMIATNHSAGVSVDGIVEQTGLDRQYVLDEIERIEAAKKQ